MAIDEMLERARSLTARCGCRGPCESCMTMAVIAAEVRTLRARAEAAERLAVWAVRHRVYWTDENAIHPSWPPGIHWEDSDRYDAHLACDGTDADILRALKEASGIDHSTE